MTRLTLKIAKLASDHRGRHEGLQTFAALLCPLLTALLLATLLLTTLSLVGCPRAPQAPRYKGAGHSQPQQGGTLIFHTSSDVRGFDPHISYDVLSTTGIKLLFDGLLDYNYEAKLVPSLAESMPEVSSDGKTFTFTLRNGVHFHNGREITADDVKWSMEHMLNPELASPAYPFFTLIEGLEAYRSGRSAHIGGIRISGRYTVSFQLTKADQTFLHAMSMTFAHPVPREMYASSDAAHHPVGSGPFRLTEWEPGVRIVFTRNKNYWRVGYPYVDRMIYLLNVSAETSTRRFRNGELDITGGFPPADYLFFKKAEAWQPYVTEVPQIDIWGLAMNCEMPPFDNRHVRRAVAFAINRPWWKQARNHRLRITGQPVPPGLLGYDAHLPSRQRYDLPKARREMKLAGYKNGYPRPVTMWLGESDASKKIGELAQSDLAKIGIEVELKQVAFPVYLEETGRRNTAQMFLTGWSQDFPDPANFLDVLFHSNAIHPRDSENRAFYRNPKLDAILDAARTEHDRNKREALYRKAQTILTEDAPWAFLWNGQAMFAWQPYVKNFKPHPVWPDYFRDVWLDLPRRAAKEDAP